MSRVLQTKSNYITQAYGRGHTGVDIVGAGGTADNIIAHSDGVVVFSQKGYGNNKGSTGNASYGNCVKIKHDNGYYTLYAHLENNNVEVGQRVTKGQVLGYMGNSGNSYGRHLHFEVFLPNNTRTNPAPYIDADLPNGSVVNEGCTGVITYQAYTNRWLDEVKKADNTADGYAGINNECITGFRCRPENGEIVYEARRLNGNWFGAVNSRDYNANNGNSYAGILGIPLDGIRIKSTQGYVDYRAKTLEDGWLPWVRGFGNGDNEYAGIKGHKIIGIQMK